MDTVLKTAVILSALTLCFAGNDTLSFSLIVSFGQEGFNSSGSVPAVDLALEHIKEQSVVGHYVLNYTTLRDSECNRSKSLDAFFREVHLSQPVKIAVLGCGCSVATEPVAEISHQWNISQVSFASAASLLSVRSRFKNFFRVYPTVDNFGFALLSTLEHYGWKRIVFLTQKENLFTMLATGFRTLVQAVASNAINICCFKGTNITVLNHPFENTSNPIPEIEDVLEENGNYRVLYLNSYSAVARHIICEAAKRNLTYPHYVWITFGWYPIRWWTQEVSKNTVNCTETQLQSFIENSRFILVRQFPTPDDENSTTTARISALEFDELYEERNPDSTFVEVTVGRLAYNAVWTLALALNRTMEMIGRNNISETGCDGKGLMGNLVPLHEFSYDNGLMGCVIRWNLEQTDFVGVTGGVKFDSAGTIIIQRIRILQYRKSPESGKVEIVRFGYVDKTAGFRFTYEDMESDQTVFPDGIPPDGTPSKVIHTFHPGLVATYYILATLGICCAIGCLLFNFIFRKKKLIRLSSPKINYLIAMGAMLMYASVYIGVNSTTDLTLNHVRCILETWFYLMGYLLAVGSILAKMWRVYHIFHNPTPKKTNLTDCHLIVMVLLVAGVGAVLVVIRSAMLHNPPSLVEDKEDKEGRTALGIMENYCVWQCYESLSAPFYLDVMIYIYLAVLEIVGIVLAFQTRKVKIPMLNDSKFVAALIYISSLILIVLLLITFVVSGYLNTISGVFYGGILILASCFLGLIFVPKIIRLYQDPEGEKIFSVSQNGTGTFQSGTVRAVLTLQGKEDDPLATLQKKIAEQSLVIQDKEKRIGELEQELSASKNGVIHRADDEKSSPSLSEQDL